MTKPEQKPEAAEMEAQALTDEIAAAEDRLAKAEDALAHALEDADPGPRVTELEAEVANLRDRLLRAVAETENVRKRGERAAEDAGRYAISGFARELLAVADNLRRAVDAVPEQSRGDHDLLESLLKGVEATERELLKVFEKSGLKRIHPLGEPYDPNFHEVMFEVAETGKPAGTVVQVLEPGYQLHDRLLRAARVAVAKGAPEARKLDTSV